MKIVAIICNIIWFGFTCIVLVTDGIPKEAAYLVFTLLMLLIPILNVVVLLGSGAGKGWLGLHMKRKALDDKSKSTGLTSMSNGMRIGSIIWNIVLLGFICWALIDQYPHPEEDGFIAYTLLTLLTPILSVVVLFLSGSRNRP